MNYDAIVIGAGQSGPPPAQRLGQAGYRVAVIERHRMGGTCVNVGCIPTKTLVGSARVAYYARQAGRFGVVVPGDVGARARIPDWLQATEVAYHTNSSMVDVDYLPQHLIIIGGSYIGLEFAQMYRRFGSEVTVVEMQDRLIGREDEDVSTAVREILEGEGVRFRLAAKCLAVRPTAANRIAIRVSCEDGPEEEQGSDLLVAVGRQPNTDDLGLEHAGIQPDERGFIPVDDTLQTAVDHIWALGEVNGRGAFTHTSYNDFEIVAANLLDNDPRRVSDRILCYGLFIDPPLGRAGLTEHEVRTAGRTALIGTLPMTSVSRAHEFGDTRGFIKIIVDAQTRQIIGAALLGLNGDEAVHGLIDLMYAKQPYPVIARSVPIHPTVSELLPTVLQNLQPMS
jgi:pyruvate/2-oxoglutarate dehydrogenase complex dihydrolipoamide dehydrogenase (E3) component